MYDICGINKRTRWSAEKGEEMRKSLTCHQGAHCITMYVLWVQLFLLFLTFLCLSHIG